MTHDLNYEELVTYLPKLLRIAQARDIPGQDCLDIAQQAIADALAQVRSGVFRGESRLSSFLYIIMQRRIDDYLRGKVKGKCCISI
jgi:DNA-directed RNA polymerase specialized sigma24 family protein